MFPSPHVSGVPGVIQRDREGQQIHSVARQVDAIRQGRTHLGCNGNPQVEGT